MQNPKLDRHRRNEAHVIPGSVEQPALKGKDHSLTAESFQAHARDPSEFEDRLLEELGAASSSSASPSEQQRTRIMMRVVIDLQKLIGSASRREDCEAELERNMRESTKSHMN